MNSQRGFSLIEALIALVILSIGLIGVAAMQLKALQSANAGYQRSVASVAAVDAQERLWSQLEPGQGCDNINVETIENQWKAQWFQNSDHSPLRNALAAQSHIARVNGEDRCQFVITLTLSNDVNDQLDYRFRLPSLEGLL